MKKRVSTKPTTRKKKKDAKSPATATAMSGTDDYYEEVQEEDESSCEDGSYYYTYTETDQTATDPEGEESTPIESATIDEKISIEDEDQCF